MFEKALEQTTGDRLFEKQLVDRNFYRRAKVFNANKKEARTLDKFEKQMRNGQEARRGARRKEFLKELQEHYKDFMEFHKRRQGKTRKTAGSVKSSLENKEKKA